MKSSCRAFGRATPPNGDRMTMSGDAITPEMSRGKQAGARSTTTQKREALLDIEAAERLQMQHVSVLAKDVALDDEPMQRLVRKVCCACEHALHCTTACSPCAKGCERY